MALITCRECGHMVSDQAVACPQCGYPVSSNVEYNFITVSNSGEKAYYYEQLEKGWKVVSEDTEYVKNDKGDVIAVHRHYKLQR